MSCSKLACLKISVWLLQVRINYDCKKVYRSGPRFEKLCDSLKVISASKKIDRIGSNEDKFHKTFFAFIYIFRDLDSSLIFEGKE